MAALPLSVFLPACTSHPQVNLASARPSIPLGVVTSAGDGRVVVHWNANDPEELVTSYTVYSAAQDWTTWNATLPSAAVDSNVSCCTFIRSGLQNEQDYWFAVGARNPNGNGPSSSTVHAKPPGWLGNRRFGTATSDVATAVAVDAAGFAYVVGYSDGSIGSEGSAGATDGVLLKLDPSGTLIAAHQWGTSGIDRFTGVALAGADVFVTGVRNNTDAVLLRFDTDGVFQQLVTVAHASVLYGIAADGSGNVFVAGYTYDNEPSLDALHWSADLNGQGAGYCADAIVARFDPTLNLIWGRELGSNTGATPCSGTPSMGLDVAYGVSLDDAGGVAIAGYTTGILAGQANSGGKDLFVARYSAATGSPIWSPVGRQVGSSSDEELHAIASDAQGNVYASGFSNGSLPLQTTQGGSDLVVLSLDSSGSPRWTRQYGGAGNDIAQAMSLSGTLHIVGFTSSGPLGPSPNNDAFVVTVDPSSGGLIWSAQPTTPDGEALYGEAISNGATLGVGIVQNQMAPSSDILVMKFDSLGNLQ